MPVASERWHGPLAGACLVAIAVVQACSSFGASDATQADAGDDAATDSATGVDASSGADASDDAAPDAVEPFDAADASSCKATPTACTSPTKTCADNCFVTYNTCKFACPNDANLALCIATCKGQLATCEDPCKSSCVSCANANMSCTAESDCQMVLHVP